MERIVRMRWRGAVALAWVGLGAGPLAWAESLPQRNLVVAWRVSASVQSAVAGGDGGGGYVLGTDQAHGSRVVRRGVGGWSAQTSDASQMSEQALMVLNGGQARLFVGQTRPQTTWQWAWSGSPQAARSGGMGADGASSSGQAAGAGATSAAPASAASGASGAATQPSVQVWAQTTWVDVGQGLSVKPSWPGGRAPVKVVFEARAVQPGRMADPDGVTRRLEASSTLLLPMDQWVVVARSGARYQADAMGTVSTRSIDQQAGEQLEIRISLP